MISLPSARLRGNAGAVCIGMLVTAFCLWLEPELLCEAWVLVFPSGVWNCSGDDSHIYSNESYRGPLYHFGHISPFRFSPSLSLSLILSLSVSPAGCWQCPVHVAP